ncbi:hypothetical protein BJD66_gp59 [Gordonia phage Emalyn]|uniref:Uncharacterized protein n=1 Tax=Gordonia phage Emalyn TaxID=1821552 RepID=A0A142KBZ5_9CAUD|nr:hypothetical protein BJD66_gp59 [Gordonia phage Emalyn]AMS03628.1 hypothetical protein SEA_EMALYN_59 [Gordonia phage Emalyn]QXN73629.1 hypothetical protein SEA_AIKOCARSON_61 [Gordonia phage AikoCarson]
MIDDDIRDIFALRDHGDIHARDLYQYIVVERGWGRDAYNDAKKRLKLKGTRRGDQYWYHSPAASDVRHLMVTQMREWVKKTEDWDHFKAEIQAAVREVKKNPHPPRARYMYGNGDYPKNGRSASTRKRRFT